MRSDDARPRRAADGRWELRLYLGTDRLTGKPIRPYRSWPADMGEDEVMRLADEWVAGLAPSAAAKSSRRLDSMLVSVNLSFADFTNEPHPFAPTHMRRSRQRHAPLPASRSGARSLVR